MTTLLSFLGGLAVGLVFLVWALRERSAKHAAEQQIKDLRRVGDNLQALVASAQKAQVNAELTNAANMRQLAVLRLTIAKLHGQLLESRDPATVRKWLEEELDQQVF